MYGLTLTLTPTPTRDIMRSRVLFAFLLSHMNEYLTCTDFGAPVSNSCRVNFIATNTYLRKHQLLLTHSLGYICIRVYNQVVTIYTYLGLVTRIPPSRTRTRNIYYKSQSKHLEKKVEIHANLHRHYSTDHSVLLKCSIIVPHPQNASET